MEKNNVTYEWTYEGNVVEKLPEGCEAFVYVITNTVSGMLYVGKKLAKFKTTKPPLKGKKNKRRGTKESDWKEYFGSSDRLNADVEELGKDSFTREIIMESSMLELAAQKFLKNT